MSVSNRTGQQPALPWRMASTAIMGLTGLICKATLYGLNRVEVHGMDNFVEILESRRDVSKRQRGLVTVSNHISIIDDPLIWGVLPMRFFLEPTSLRWSLGAHDIIYKNKLLGTFFMAGQTLPTHRLHHSDLGGPFQPTMTQAIRLLSSQPYSAAPPSSFKASIPAHLLTTYLPSPIFSTTKSDLWMAPSYFPVNRYSWVHVFPEGYVHQQDQRGLRYFKWGAARLILESEPAPDVVPMFVDGSDEVMPDDRGFPRFLPRLGKSVRVAFGEKLDFDEVFGDLRARWKKLVAESEAKRAKEVERIEKEKVREKVVKAEVTEKKKKDPRKEKAVAIAASPLPSVSAVSSLGELDDPELRDGAEARAIRTEVSLRMRREVLKLRKQLGYADEPESKKLGLAETWAKEPHEEGYRSPVDGSLVNKKGT